MGVTEILCNFKLVLDGKTGKDIPESSRLEFLENISANNFALSDAEDNTSDPLNRGVQQIYLENTISNSPKVPWVKFLRSNGLFCFISMCKFGSFKNPFAMITSLSELYFRIRRFIFWYKQNKWFLWTMAAAQAAENYGDKWDVTWYFPWGIYTSIPTWTHSQNSLAAAEAPSLKITSHGTSLKWSLRPTQSAYE